MKIVKKISLLVVILASISALASCSSGSSSGNGALNLTGRWDGSVTLSNGGFVQATMTISQDRELTLAGESDYDAVMNIGGGCSLAIENGTVNGRNRTITSGVGEFSWVGVASNSQITGDLTSVSDDAGNNSSDEEPSLCDFILGPFRFNRI